jgi:hypothetical protein
VAGVTGVAPTLTHPRASREGASTSLGVHAATRSAAATCTFLSNPQIHVIILKQPWVGNSRA